MKSLYILNNPNLYHQCKKAMTDTDSLLLIEDAVALSLQATVKNHYVLEEDLIARALLSSCHNSWTLVDYTQFVDLTLKLDKTITWL